MNDDPRLRRTGATGLLALAIAAALMLAVAAPALAAHEFTKAFGGAGQQAGQIELTGASGLAVNYATHDIYIADTGNARVDEFSATGAFIRAWGWGVTDGSSSFQACTSTCQAGIAGAGVGQFTTPTYIAVDNSGGPSAGDVYVADTGDRLVTKFDASGNVISIWGDAKPTNGQLSGSNATSGPFTGIAGMTVDTSGKLIVRDSGDANWFEFAQDGTPEPTVANEQRNTEEPGIGVDSNGNLYKVPGTYGLEQFSPSAADIGPVTPGYPESIKGFAIDPTTNDIYADVNGFSIQRYEGSSLTSCVESGTCTPAETFGTGQMTSAAAVAVDPATGTVYVAELLEQRIYVFAPAPPAVAGTAVANLTANSADLTAKIDPNGFDTHYYIEYGTTTGYGTRLPALEAEDPDIGSAATAVSVSQHITGLLANTTYHWRVVATNANGSTPNVDHTFIYDTTDQGLPDGRAYEQVTPVQKNGALIEGQGAHPIDIAPDGSSVIFSSVQCFAGSSSCDLRASSGFDNPFHAVRGSDGWVTMPMDPPAGLGPNSGVEDSAASGYALFSIATPPAGEDDFYAREPDGTFVDIGPFSPPSSRPLGPVLGGGADTPYASADLSHLAWVASVPWSFVPEHASTVYQYAGTKNSQPLLVGVTGGYENGENHNLINQCFTSFGGASITDSHPPGAMSADGSTVFFTAQRAEEGCSTAPAATEVGARIDGTQSDAHTVILSQRSPADCTSLACLSSPPGDAKFWGASSDGTKAFFTSTQQLTDGASEDNTSKDSGGSCTETVGANGCNLYLYDFADPSGHELIDVSGGDTSGGGPRVQGVVGFSSDGSHVYFIANGVLAGGAQKGDCRTLAGQEVGECNLYAYQRDVAHTTGTTSFIATISASEMNRLTSLQWPQANVTPDGRYLVFTSAGPLTADGANASGARQVYRYDSQTGQLIRLSVGNGGFNDNGNSGTGDATIVPAFDFTEALGAARLDPTMSDDGSYVFFQSPIALTPHALNDIAVDSSGDLAENVYEWHDGRVYLISDGRDTSASSSWCNHDGRWVQGSSVCLLGADTTGANVFFVTTDQLMPQDGDSGQDIYDARIGGGIPYTPPSPPCLGEQCHGVPPAIPGPASTPTSTFNGTGNLLSAPGPVSVKPKLADTRRRAGRLTKALHACRKARARRRRSCEAGARKRYGASKSTATSDRRASR